MQVANASATLTPALTLFIVNMYAYQSVCLLIWLHFVEYLRTLMFCLLNPEPSTIVNQSQLLPRCAHRRSFCIHTVTCDTPPRGIPHA